MIGLLSAVILKKKGFFNISTQKIVKSRKIISRNLTNHVPKKEYLLQAIRQKTIDYPSRPIMPHGQYTTLAHLGIIFNQFFQVRRQFSFFFANLQYLHYEYHGIIFQYKEVGLGRLEQARLMVAYYVQTRRLKPAENRIHHETLIKNIRVSNTIWKLHSALLGGNNDFREAIEHVWYVIIPNLTKKGLKAYLEINSIQTHKLINNNGGT